MISSIYNQTIEERIERLQKDIEGRDYEGCTTVLTSDIVEVLKYLENVEHNLEDYENHEI